VTPHCDDPIGVFDSGVGGLSVLRDIRRELPHEELLYVADSGHAPYGDRSVDFVTGRSIAVAEFLIGQRAKALVIACNTATAMAVETLRGRYTLPIVAIDPAVKPAAATTRSGVLGVLATTNTLSSIKFARLVDQYAGGATVLTQACPGLVEQIEEGDLSGPRTRALVEQYVRPMLARGADTIVLGCTHYPFVADLVRDVAGPDISIVDPAVAVAREVRRRLAVAGLLTTRTTPGGERFWTRAPPAALRRVLASLWPRAVEVAELPV
jgi:glutamate racemase